MRRILSVCSLLLSIPLVASAAPPNQPANVVNVIRLTVQPKAAPKPALKYQLLPELREMKPGNPILEYTRCFAEQHNFWRTKESIANREKWQTMPLRDLPVKEIRQSYGYTQGRGPLSFADAAARLETPDWQILMRLKSDGVNTLLPDVQGLRELAGALKVRFRVEIAERHFDDAIVTAKTMLALARHFNEHPTVIGDLVGIAIASLALGTVDEMIEQPGCPNLFWALTDLPSPFIDIRKGVQGDRVMIEAEMPGLSDREPMTDAQVRKIVQRLQKAINGPKDPEDAVSKWVEGRAKDKEHVRAARKRLVEALTSPDATRFDSFPPLQIVLLDAKLDYEIVRDEVMKALTLPYWQARRILESIPPIPVEKQTPLLMLLSRFDGVKMAQGRVDQRIALLRCVEALRIYAAEHDGKLPAKLDDIPLPLPVDPATGKPFSYKVEGKTAYLHGEPLNIEVRYEVTIGK
jgi:hypothetical protein